MNSSSSKLINISSFSLEFNWCKICGKNLKYFQYLKNSDFSSTAEEETNKKENLAKEKFEGEHNLNCEKKKAWKLDEFSKKLQEKLSEMPSKKMELETTFDEDIATMEEIIKKGFFKQLINSAYLHFCQKLPSELFPYSINYVNFGGFEESDGRKGWNVPDIFRYKTKDQSIIRQVFKVSLNKKYKNELTKLDSCIEGYGFPRLIETMSHELAHCLLGDFFRICGYSGDYSHRVEHKELMKIIENYLWNTQEIRLILPLQIKWIEKKITYFEEELWHLQDEERKMKSFGNRGQDFQDKRSKRDEIRDIMKYLAELQINKEKLKEKDNN